MATQHPTQHQFKGLDDWIEVFRAGTHTDSKGQTVTFTAADLDQMAANVAALGAVPAVLGHPKHNDPAYGWAREAKREGENLFVRFSDINPAFEAGVASGAYRNRSISVYKDPKHGWRPRHVGWLGAAPPAIDGLQPLDYSAAELPDQHEFAIETWSLAGALDDMAAMARSWREHLIATATLETADQVAPEWRISSLTAAATRLREPAETSTRLFSAPITHPTPAGADMSLTQADLDRTAAETEARVRNEFAAQTTADKAELERLRTERQAERIATQITGWKAAGQLLPAEEPGLAEFMAALEGGSAVEFQFTAAGGGTATKKTPAQFFADFVAARGKLVRLGGGGLVDLTDDPAANGRVVSFNAQPGYDGVQVDAERAELDRRIKTHMAENKCDYTAAAAAVMAIPSKA